MLGTVCIGTGVFKSNRIEFMAIPLMVVLLGVLFVVFAVAEIGVWAWILTGVVILAAILLLVCASRSVTNTTGGRRSASRGATSACGGPSHPRGRRPELRTRRDQEDGRSAQRRTPVGGIRRRSRGRLRLDRLTGDEAGYENAARHLDETLEEFAGVRDLDVRRGKVGAHDPIQAADEALREFPADEIVFAVDPGASNFLEEGEIERTRSRYGIPVTKVVSAPTEPV